MKKQIVITLEQAGDEYRSTIYGQIGNKKTDNISGLFATKQYALDCISSNIPTIEKWMEQIA